MKKTLAYLIISNVTGNVVPGSIPYQTDEAAWMVARERYGYEHSLCHIVAVVQREPEDG